MTTTKAAATKRKQPTNSEVEEDVEVATSKPQATKRKRTVTSKDSKSVKVRKDVNDNELVNEEAEQEDNEEGA